MARRFINDRLVTIKRFAPGQYDVPVADKVQEPVPAELGVTPVAEPADRAALAARTLAAPAPVATASAAPAPVLASAPAPPPLATATATAGTVPAQSQDLQHVLRREDEELRSGLREKELEEFRRRQREVREQLTRAIQTLEHEQSLAQARLELLQRLESELAGLQSDADRPRTSDEFRSARRAVDQAYLELLKLERDELEETPARDHARVDIASLTFAQLTRIGLGLTWPVIIALLLAAAVVAIALLSVFGRA